ncbi:ubiquitin carboxyl-terminal hydrolase 17-like protein 6 [Rana temporaria]|uniref:ubiquitin carboxyl-terminal hydrolase 17-like protein 6 n=1 Tax=Rana temporaria TaxID=8407 RepID=UPI001AAC82BC|nr:ubiquitin carboxyl-terminal hydrolase 17-like protein 6 [Rana temporaria]
MTMQNIAKVGAGLQNFANNCFVNSVLQCLTHTALLADYLLTGEHSQNFIAEHFELGRQEDANEFLTFLIAQLRTSSIYESVFRSSFDQTKDRNIGLIDHIFSGTLQTQVVCQSCHYASNRFEEFLDIPLEINSSKTILESLKNFTRTERLEGDNAYRCNGCYQLVSAEMRSTIDNTPNVLILTLKRFNAFSGRKLSKDIKYPETFDIAPYTLRPDDHINYNLYAVIVHRGHFSTEGHYYAYVKAGDDRLYKMNDSEVTPCSISNVLQQQAYLLFYKKAQTEPCPPKTAESTSEAPKALEVEEKAKEQPLKDNERAIVPIQSLIRGTTDASVCATQQVDGLPDPLGPDNHLPVETEEKCLPNIETVQEEEKKVKKNRLYKLFCITSSTNDQRDEKKKKNKKKCWLLRLLSPKSSTNDNSKENKEEKKGWLRKLARRN